MLTAFRALVRKDLRLFLTDRRAVLMSVVAPIVVASFFGYVLGGTILVLFGFVLVSASRPSQRNKPENADGKSSFEIKIQAG